VFGFGIVDERHQRLDHLVGLGRWLPVLGVNDWQAHLALLVDVRMVDLGLEGHLRRLERILGYAEKKSKIWFKIQHFSELSEL
jgi:hypothetical protein